MDTLLYDGDCSVCSTLALWAQRLAPHVAVRPHQWVDVTSLGLSTAECDAALQWVGSHRRASGGQAVAQLLVAAGGGWSLLGRLLTLPVIRFLVGVVYRAIAASRHRLPGGTPMCRR